MCPFFFKTQYIVLINTMSFEERRQKYANMKNLNTLFMDLRLPRLDHEDYIIDYVDEESSFLLLWETIEFGYDRGGNEQLQKRWFETTQQQMQDVEYLA